jgi:circadian clock protein KaiC
LLSRGLSSGLGRRQGSAKPAPAGELQHARDEPAGRIEGDAVVSQAGGVVDSTSARGAGWRRDLAKAPSGIRGLDEITCGGLPRARPTLVCGAAGCGKTLLGMQFLARGALEYGEPGVFLSFEETADELAANVASLGIDLDRLRADGLLAVDHIRLEPSEIEETGDYDLEGLFVRLAFATESVGAKRVVIDTIETLFAAFSDAAVVRAELRRLFRWLKERGLTAVITGERGEEGRLTRYGIEEYVSDCVIVLDHRVDAELSTRRLRVLKYRGSLHGTNEYPFLIGPDGIVVLPITSLGLQHQASAERVSTGIPRLDTMLAGGVFRGTSVLVSGAAGTGKTTIATHFVQAACAREERALFLAFEESESQILRNMRSVGIDLEPWVRAGLLRFTATRPSQYGLEVHLATLLREVDEFDPAIVVLDPMSGLVRLGSRVEVSSALIREVDFLKAHQVTALFTSLTHDASRETSGIEVSSLIDTWLAVENVEENGERNRLLYVLKSRGTAHSNQVREFVLTDHGVDLVDVYVGSRGVRTGSARLVQAAEERTDAVRRAEAIERLERRLQRAREAVEAQVAALWREFDAEADDVRAQIRSAADADAASAERDRELVAHRWSDAFPSGRDGEENDR